MPFPTRRAEIEAAMEARGPRAIRGAIRIWPKRAALMTRAPQARRGQGRASRGLAGAGGASLGFPADRIIDEARERRELSAESPDRAAGAGPPGRALPKAGMPSVGRDAAASPA